MRIGEMETVQKDDGWSVILGKKIEMGPLPSQEDAERASQIYINCGLHHKKIITFGKKWDDTYRFLSNFWPAPVDFEKITYPSVEHAYQAAKTLDEEARIQIAMAPSAASAKRRGGRVPLREDWSDVTRLRIMRPLLAQKFNQEPMRTWLMLTLPVTIEEGNNWGDQFWGVVQGVGHNHLGRLLMKLRDDLWGAHKNR